MYTERALITLNNSYDPFHKQERGHAENVRMRCGRGYGDLKRDSTAKNVGILTQSTPVTAVHADGHYLRQEDICASGANWCSLIVCMDEIELSN
jgi:hypothetical protein